MSCSKCGSSTSCGCSGTAYYLDADVCIEDHCQKTYEQQFTFAICPKNSWNVPSCGQSAVLRVPGILGAAIGSYLWNSSFGYFQVTSVDASKGQIGVVNSCVEGNASPGTQIPKCTCFVVTAEPVTNNSASLFPFLAIDFTAPADGNCVDITLTTSGGIAAGDIISIGTGSYTVDSFLSSTVIRICNNGDGIYPGTPVIAKDLSGKYVYPVNVISSCCAALAPTVAANTADIVTNTADIVTNTAAIALNTAAIADLVSTGGGDTDQVVGGGPLSALSSGNASLSIVNASATRTTDVLVIYTATFAGSTTVDLLLAGGFYYTRLNYKIEVSVNGGAFTSIVPAPFTKDAGTYYPPSAGNLTITTSIAELLQFPVIYTVAPSATLTLDAAATVTITAGTGQLQTGFKVNMDARYFGVRL